LCYPPPTGTQPLLPQETWQEKPVSYSCDFFRNFFSLMRIDWSTNKKRTQENEGQAVRFLSGIALADRGQRKMSMTPRGLLEHLVDFERRIRRVYLTLGDRVSFPAEVRFLWNSMAEDERHHLAILERSSGLLDLMELPPQVSERTRSTLEAKVAAAEAAVARPELSSDEAFTQALILEGSELNSLDEAWFGGFRPTLGSLLQAMWPEEEVHIRRLVEAVQTFSTDATLQQQAAALWSAYRQQHLHSSEHALHARGATQEVMPAKGGPCMDEAFRFADALGPSKIIHIYEPVTGLKAVLAVDNVACGPAIGGIRMAPDVSTEEAFRLARAMTLKNAAAGLPHGGGKAVIVGDPKMPMAKKEQLIRAFACAIKDITEYIPGPDMGTDERCMAWIKDEIDRAVGLPPEIGGIPLDEIGATGFGLSICLDVARKFCDLDLRGARIVVQGFGSVGKHAARLLVTQGAVLVGVADSQGTLFNPDGLDVARLIELKSAGKSVIDYAEGNKLDASSVIDLECDVWIPAARPDVIREENVARLKTKLIVPGANIPVTPAAERILHDRHVLVVPDFIANAGGVICAAVEYHSGTQTIAFQMIEEKIRSNTTLVLEEATKQGTLPRQAAVALAERRVRDAMTYRRWSSAGAEHTR
jgi:glutamate dehydrogenase (NAD(P)+)